MCSIVDAKGLQVTLGQSKQHALLDHLQQFSIVLENGLYLEQGRSGNIACSMERIRTMRLRGQFTEEQLLLYLRIIWPEYDPHRHQQTILQELGWETLGTMILRSTDQPEIEVQIEKYDVHIAEIGFTALTQLRCALKPDILSRLHKAQAHRERLIELVNRTRYDPSPGLDRGERMESTTRELQRRALARKDQKDKHVKRFEVTIEKRLVPSYCWWKEAQQILNEKEAYIWSAAALPMPMKIAIQGFRLCTTSGAGPPITSIRELEKVTMDSKVSELPASLTVELKLASKSLWAFWQRLYQRYCNLEMAGLGHIFHQQFAHLRLMTPAQATSGYWTSSGLEFNLPIQIELQAEQTEQGESTTLLMLSPNDVKPTSPSKDTHAILSRLVGISAAAQRLSRTSCFTMSKTFEAKEDQGRDTATPPAPKVVDPNVHGMIAFEVPAPNQDLQVVVAPWSGERSASSTEHKLNQAKVAQEEPRWRNRRLWQRLTADSELGSLLKPELQALNMRRMSNAALKAMELFHNFDIFHTTSPSLVYFDNAAFPGSFILAADYLIKTRYSHIVDFCWYANSLMPDQVHPHALGDDYGLYERYPERWMMNPSKGNNGDVTRLENQQDIESRLAKQVDVYTSDLGTGHGATYDRQEEQHVFPHVGQILTGLIVLSPGGRMIVKQFTFFQHYTQALIGVVASLFRQVFIVKPATSKPDNSESYLVCLDLMGDPSETIVMLKCLLAHQQCLSLVQTVMSRPNWLRHVEAASEYLAQRQVEELQLMVHEFGQVYSGEMKAELSTLMERNRALVIWWLRKHRLVWFPTRQHLVGAAPSRRESPRKRPRSVNHPPEITQQYPPDAWMPRPASPLPSETRPVSPTYSPPPPPPPLHRTAEHQMYPSLPSSLNTEGYSPSSVNAQATHSSLNTEGYSPTHPSLDAESYSPTHPSLDAESYSPTHPSLNTEGYSPAHPSFSARHSPLHASKTEPSPHAKTQTTLTDAFQFHNQIKAVLIDKYVKPGAVVLDVGIGKGGDLGKYKHAGAAHVIGIDASRAHLDEASNRLCYHTQGFQDLRSMAANVSLIHGDWINDMPAPIYAGVHVAVANFSLHYFFASEHLLRSLLIYVWNALGAQGGYFVGTVVDGDRLMVSGQREHDDFSFNIQGQKAEADFGTKVDMQIAGSIISEGSREFLVKRSVLTKTAEQCGFHVVEIKNFEEWWKSDPDQTPMPVLSQFFMSFVLEKSLAFV